MSIIPDKKYNFLKPETNGSFAEIQNPRISTFSSSHFRSDFSLREKLSKTGTEKQKKYNFRPKVILFALNFFKFR